MTYKLLIFDLDGTLLETRKDLAIAVNHSLEMNNLPAHTIEEVSSFVNNGSKVLITKAIGKEVNELTFNKIFQDYFDFYKEHANIHTYIYDGINDLIKYAKDNGMILAVLSNKPHDICVPLVEFYFPKVFDLILGDRNNHPRKPDPSLIDEILNILNIKKEETLYIGDSVVDVAISNNANIQNYILTYGYTDWSKIAEKPANLINSPLEIIEILKTII